MSAPRAGRPEAASVIWRWRDLPGPTGRGPSARRARLVGTAQALVGALAATLLYRFWSTTMGTVVYAVSALILLSALLSPGGAYRAIQGLFDSLGHATGRALTWLVMVPLFYLFFFPFGLLMRRGRRDRMKRRFEPDLASYWEPHKAFSAADHERQF